MIYYSCPACGYDLKIGDEYAGRPAHCWHCRNVHTVPMVSTNPPRNNPQSNRMINFTCLGCGAALQIDKKWAGRLGHCPHCGVNSPVPGNPRRSSKIGILARMCAVPFAVVAFWAFFYGQVADPTWFILGGVGAVVLALLYCWGGTHLFAMIFEREAYKVWKRGGGDPWFDTLDPPFNNDPPEVRYQEIFREQLRQDEEQA